jgi:hypothetical protein
MGNSFSLIRASATVEVSAPAECLWEVISDLDSLPEFLTELHSIQRKSGGDFQVGTRWREERTCHGTPSPQHKTITAITNPDGFPRSVCINVCHLEAYRDDINTTALTVVSVDENNAQLIGTFAYHVVDFCFKVTYFICRPLVVKKAKKYFLTEMEEYAAAAERRYQAKMQPESPLQQEKDKALTENSLSDDNA